MTIQIGGDTARERPRISVRLVGVDYAIRKPKALAAMRLAANAKQMREDAGAEGVEATYREWLEFTCPEHAEAIMGRLADPDDALELSHLNEMVSAVSEAVLDGDPTTSSSD